MPSPLWPPIYIHLIALIWIAFPVPSVKFPSLYKPEDIYQECRNAIFRGLYSCTASKMCQELSMF